MILRLVYATETGLIMIRDETSTRIVGNEIQWFEIAYGVINKFFGKTDRMADCPAMLER